MTIEQVPDPVEIINQAMSNTNGAYEEDVQNQVDHREVKIEDQPNSEAYTKDKPNSEAYTNDKPKSEADTKETKQLRNYLKLYFYSAIKWKGNALSIHLIYCFVFLLQIIKVAFVTTQMFKFGNDRASFGVNVAKGHLTLRHLLLKDWDASWETLPYPPTRGEFAVYDIEELESRINYAVERYYNAEQEAIGFYKRWDNDGMVVKLKYFDAPIFEDAQSSGLRIHDVEFAIDKGIENHRDPVTNATKTTYIIVKEFAHQNISQPFKRLLSITLESTIHSVRVVEGLGQVRCLTVHASVSFEDLDNNGLVIQNLETLTKSLKCSEVRDVNLSVPDWTDETTSEVISRNVIGAVVIVLCVLSLLFTTASVIFALFLIVRTKKYMKRYYRQYYKDPDGKDLPKSQYFVFVKFWDVTVILADILTLIGTIGIVFEIKKYKWVLSKLDSETVWLGTGCLLSWLSLLRFFKFHNKFHLIFRTFYHAFLDVLAYLLCVAVLFGGFWASGYVVMGPYHVKFRTPAATAETLLSVVHGDEIFATLNILDESKLGGNWVWWFSRVYIGAYVALFTVVGINILIAIFMSAYESIKKDSADRNLGPVEKALKRFLGTKQDGLPNSLRSSVHDLMSTNRPLSKEEITLRSELKNIVNVSSSGLDVCLFKPKTLKEFYEDNADVACGCIKISFKLFSEK